MDAVGSQPALLTRLLEAAELRSRVISANIANQNTPGYLRRVVRFEDLLSRQMSEGRREEDVLESVQPTVELDELSPRRPDGNNVSLEAELNSMRENRLMYETYAAILSAHFQLMQTAVTEGR